MELGFYTDTSRRGNVYVRLIVWEDDVSIANNDSRLNYQIIIQRGTKTWDTSWTSWGEKIYIDFTIGGYNPGRVYVPRYNYGGYNLPGSVFAEGNFRIAHNNDGSKSIDLWCKLTDTANGSNSNGYYTPGNGEGTLYGQGLTTIARASQPSTSGSTAMGSNMTVYMNRASTSFTHIVDYAFGNTSGRIASSVGDSCTWAVPMDLANQIPNATSGTGTITVYTYNGGTHIGTKTVGFTLTVPTSVKPSISAKSLSDINTEITKHNFGIFVAGKSKANLGVTAAGSYSSTISKYKITIEGTSAERNSLSDLNSWLNTLALSAGTGKTFKVQVTDSRGRTSDEVSGTYNVNGYSSPAISAYSVVRCNSSGVETDDGTYLKFFLAATATNINNGKNKFNVRVGYKKKSATTYTYINKLTDSTTTFSVNYTGTSAFVGGSGNVDANSSYDIIFEVWDLLTSSNKIQRTKDVGTGFDLVHYHKSGKAIAFGKKSEAGDNQKLAEFGMDVDIKEALLINGTKMLWYE